MSRSLGVVCAGAMMCAVAGCTLDSFVLSLNGAPNRKEQTVDVSVDRVSAMLHTTLGSRFGINVVESRVGEEIHLKGQTKTGKTFDFILQRQRSEKGDRTLIAFEGEKEAESLLLEAVVLAVTNAPPTQPTQPQNNPSRLTFDQIHGEIQ